jgi:CRP/FNR family cyclic AMP-dependent transcriptional regulator
MSVRPDRQPSVEIFESCPSCPVRQDRPFCRLDDDILAELDKLGQRQVYSRGQRLFEAGSAARNALVLCQGRVKLTASSVEGRSAIVRLADAGEVLGLASVVLGRDHDVTAEALTSIQVNAVAGERLLEFFRRHAQAAQRITEQLALELGVLYRQMAQNSLEPSARARLASFILDCGGGTLCRGTDYRLPLTHQEIGELIGTTRETITRLLAQFREEGLIETGSGGHVRVLQPAGLAEASRAR